jgi:outer membrane protein TolC
VLVVALASAISGCAVGPDFSPVPAPPVDTYLPGKLAAPDGGKGEARIAGQHFVSGADVSARWWAAFQSPALDDLVRQSVEHNPTLQSAEGAIKIAYYNALAQRGVFFPQVTGNSTSSQFLIANPGQVPSIPTEGAQTEFSLVTNQSR